MANITKTFLFPVPTEWMGQEQDDDNVGIATYNGPDRIKVRYYLDANGNKTSRFYEAISGDRANVPDPPIDAYEVILNAETHPLHAAIIYGGVAGPELINVAAGPAEDPDPEIHAPDHLQEVYDCESFYWDPTANGGDGAWSTPVFSHSIGNNGVADEDDFSFGWEWVRATRDQLLAACDQRVPADAPEGFGAPWREYRQKLRDLPAAWAGVGTATHLVVWPRDPDQQEFDRREALRDINDPNQ